MFAHSTADAPLTTVMPPEWAPHDRTWMAFPPANDTFGPPGSATLHRARAAWTTVARTVAAHEPVTVAVAPEDATTAAALLGPGIDTVEVPLDDAWMRDSGPTFVHGPDGRVAAVDWIFNGWGAQDWAAWDSDRRVGTAVAERSGVPRIASPLVNEGGGIHVDGAGTVLLTETVQLDPGRNPGLTKADVEAEVHARLGTSHAVWLPRGLWRDYDDFGTRGHVDIVAAFTASGTLLLHRQDDPRHPDHEITRDLRRVLEQAVDARGEKLRIVDVPAPRTLTDEDGSFVDWSYINHYVTDGAVVLCSFDDPNDLAAAQILAEAYPGRTVEQVDARDIFRFGGGIHCITQQQPAPRTEQGSVR
ncbi:agmatine deiminase family protein [Nocardiopsis sp. HNM0947]|uniref:Agmatine deiminase family protein n=1 Tax=Nocardiopsis coralli TaxID=2772213 RepID=A0ABR9PA75_9ACTN|nr:agmatine deiminase family protein [Nocardiopsis coralli]MBE3000744.1 agmatine deiminase family protein [Nocardiopsis coralli]